MNILILFIFGLIFGSFLNAVIYRLKSGDGIIKERSKCPKCQHVLGFWDLVPLLSFVFLQGKCRYCKKNIFWQYPTVELFTGLVFVTGLTLNPQPSTLNPQLITFIIFSLFLIIIFVYDLKHYLILDKVSLPAFFIALLLNYYLGRDIINLLLASVIVAGFFAAQFIVSKGKWIGGGDIRLGLVMGAMLGLPYVFVALFLAYISGAVIGVALILIKKKKWSSKVPFGTFLTAATLITLLFGRQLLNWYLTCFGIW